MQEYWPADLSCATSKQVTACQPQACRHVPTVARGQRAFLLFFNLVQVPPPPDSKCSCWSFLQLSSLITEVSVEGAGYTNPGPWTD